MNMLVILFVSLVVVVSTSSMDDNENITSNPTMSIKEDGNDSSTKVGEHVLHNVAEAVDKGVGAAITAIRGVLEEHRKLFDSILDHGIFGWFKSKKS